MPENLKSNSFIATAKNLLNIHNGLNNFYNEPLAAKLLSSMGTMIPDPAVCECLNAVIICVTGNGYGVSNNAQGYLQAILDGITTTKWILYLKDLPRNATLLHQLGYIEGRLDPVEIWCHEISKRNLQNLVFTEKWINVFLEQSANNNKTAVRNMAAAQYRQINGIK